jgi:hypothetical protein
MNRPTVTAAARIDLGLAPAKEFTFVESDFYRDPWTLLRARFDDCSASMVPEDDQLVECAEE